MRLLYNTVTQAVSQYPRSDDEDIVGLSAEYLAMTVTHDETPAYNPVTQLLARVETIDVPARTIHYSWTITDLPPAVKVWPTKSEFWAELTDTEKAGIITCPDVGIKLLDKELTMWTATVRADDARILAGLTALVTAGILSESRKTEILSTITP